jgi:hypothetical protein
VGLYAMKNIIIPGVILVSLYALAGRASADFIVNGGFETGDFTGWTLVGNSQTTFVDQGFTHTGTYSALLGETGGLGSLSQAITTNSGTSYALDFWFAGNDDVPSEFTASVDGKRLLDLVNPGFDLDYMKYEYMFVATSSSTIVSFGFRDDDFFLNLDDVSVNVASVPEPGSVLLFITAVTICLAVHTFKWKFALLRRA